MTNGIELQDDEVFASLDGEQVEYEQPRQEQPVEQDDLPDKYKGKSPKDIAKMHQEAEKLIGRHSQEVAELRRLADDLIKQQLKQPKVEESPEVDFFENPKAAVRKAVEDSPEFQEVVALKQQIKQQEVHKTLSAKHGDYQSLVNTPEFIEWVKGSKARVQMFTVAHNEMDADIADELLTNYKLQNGVKADNQQEVRDKQLKAAGVENSGSGVGAAKKIYRRADLIRLSKEDPRRYQKMNDEIMRAYQEGRVR